MVATGYLAYSFSVSMCHFETLHSPGNCRKALHLCIYEYGNLGINKLVASVRTPICWIREELAWDPNCYFCNTPESSVYLFFECPVAKVTWGIDAICFGQISRPCSYECYE
jgi:hypothetical protein